MASNTEQDENDPTTENVLPCIFDGKFFTYLPSESSDKKRVARCTLCAPREVIISGSRNATSNFVTHLKRKHGEVTFNEYMSYSKTHKRHKRHSSTLQNTQLSLRQDDFNRHIANYFIHSMCPLQSIDNPYFKKIFDYLEISRSGLSVMSRRTLGRCINENYEKSLTDLKKELEDIKTVCTTADIWSGKKRSFLGVTCHWINPNLERVSATLACRRFAGTHSYDRIALLLESIHTEFDLDCQKVLATVTDSGSNFVKAFKEFGLDEESCNFTDEGSESEGDESVSVIGQVLDSGSSSNTSQSLMDPLNDIDPLSLSIENVNAGVSATQLLSTQQLPAHLRCCAHKLSLCCTTDSNKVLNVPNTRLSTMHKQVLTKCNTLWNAANRPKSAEIIQRIIGHTLSRPGATRWNSVYDSLKQISSIRSKSAQLHLALNIKNPLMEIDFQYIDEYLKCSKPIAEALDILQGDKDLFYGIALPTLLSLRKKLTKLTEENFSFCNSLAAKYLDSVNVRFQDFFDLFTPTGIKAMIATISYPRFKDKWLVVIEQQHHRRIKNIFKQQIALETQSLEENARESSNTCTNKDDDSYFVFDTDSSEGEYTESLRSTRPEINMSKYLSNSDEDTSMLNRHSEMKQIYTLYRLVTRPVWTT